MTNEVERTGLDALLGDGMIDSVASDETPALFFDGEGQAEEVPEAPLHGNVTNVDTMDREYWDDLAPRNRYIDELRDAHKIAKKETDHPETDPAFDDLLQDGFGAFYKWAPRVLDEVNPARELNKSIINQMLELPEYQQLRNYTRGDEFASVAALDVVRRIFDTVPEEAKQKQRDVEEAQKKVDQLVQQAGESGGEGKPGLQKVIDKAVAERNEAAEELQEQIEAGSDQVRQDARKALQQAAADAEDTEEIGKAIGWGNQFGSLSNVPVSERIKLAQRLQSLRDIRKLADLVGRMIRIAQKKQAEKIEYERQVIEGIERGNCIPDVVPEEFAKLMVPETRILFYKGFAERTLQQYRLNAKEEVGRGPIYIDIDCSSSMSGPCDRWAKAVALTLFWIARKQKREFGVCLFNTRVTNEAYFPKGCVPTVNQVADIFGSGCGGGTAYEPPLLQFLNVLAVAKRDGKEIKRADLVFITDGECSIRPDVLDTFNRARKEHGFNVYSVMVGNRHGNKAVLEPFSTKVFSLGGASGISGNQQAVFDATFSI